MKSRDTASERISPQILAEQTRFAFEVFPVVAPILLLSAALIVYLAHPVDAALAKGWGATAGVLFGLRLLVYGLYRRRGGASTWWWRAFCAGALAWAGLLGAAVLLFFTAVPDASRMVLSLLLLGTASVAMPLLAGDLRVYAAYLVLSIGPLALLSLAQPPVETKLIGAVLLVFIVMLLLAGHLFGRALVDSLIYRYRSEHLMRRLQVANDRLSRVNGELERLSTLDELTGAYNRRAFNLRLAETWADHLREGKPLAALMIDVDQFKRYNDLFGHLAGDHCLRRIGGELRAVVKRPRDFVARYGGEEFVILLPGTEAAGAAQVAERIHERIRALAIPHKRDDGHDRVTVSIGGASVRPTAEYDPERFLERLDQALYQAKRAGRNTTVFL